jgi:hypothetical protein
MKGTLRTFLTSLSDIRDKINLAIEPVQAELSNTILDLKKTKDILEIEKSKTKVLQERIIKLESYSRRESKLLLMH